MKKISMKRFAATLKKNKATIFAVAASVGVVATAVLSANAALKAEDILRKDNEEGVDKKQKAIDTIPKLIPPVLAAGTTIAFILLCNIENKKTQIALASAYTLASQKLTRYRNAVKEVCGEEKAKQVDEKIFSDKIAEWEMAAEKQLCGNDPVSKDDELFYDEFSQRYFWSTPENVRDAEYYLNRCFAGCHSVTLNDFYRLIGIDEVDYGDDIGWDSYLGEVYFGYTWIDFEHLEHPASDEDTPPCHEIFFPFQPHVFDEEIIEKGLINSAIFTASIMKGG